jgi:hypothetical protein
VPPGHVFHQILCFNPVSVIPPCSTLHMPFLCHHCHIICTNDTPLNKALPVELSNLHVTLSLDKLLMFQGIIVHSSLGSSSLQWESFPFFLDCLMLKLRALQSFKILGITHPTAQCHLNLKQHCCQNLT